MADCAYNAEQIIAHAREAAAAGAKLAAFPELCLTGYTCGDLFLQEPLLRGAEDGLVQILQETADLSMLLVIGLPYICGGALYNCAAVCYAGKILGMVPKQNLPNYSEFYEGPALHRRTGRRSCSTAAVPAPSYRIHLPLWGKAAVQLCRNAGLYVRRGNL